MGWSLSEHGLWPWPLGTAGARALSPAGAATFATEAELYAALELQEIPPELREGQGEVEAAEAGGLPRLVRLEDLRGDCHSHSDWSDGREPLEVMVDSARAAGRRYQVAHRPFRGASASPTACRRRASSSSAGSSASSTSASPDSWQPVSCRQAPARRASSLLHGCELEITADGRLDYDDALLARFDVVVASLHVGRRQPRAQLMARYELAMRSPHVDIISHPSGRKIGQRPDLDLDWEAFYRAGRRDGHAARDQRQRGAPRPRAAAHPRGA